MEGFGPSPDETEAAREAFGRMAAMLAEYVDQLTSAGFSRVEAVQLAVGAQRELLNSSGG